MDKSTCSYTRLQTTLVFDVLRQQNDFKSGVDIKLKWRTNFRASYFGRLLSL